MTAAQAKLVVKQPNTLWPVNYSGNQYFGRAKNAIINDPVYSHSFPGSTVVPVGSVHARCCADLSLSLIHI